MNFFKELSKKCKLILLISLFSNVMGESSAFAQGQGGGDGGADLRWIRYYTYLILDKIDKFPVYIEPLKKMAESWLDDKDDKQTFANNQSAFANLNLTYSTDVNKNDILKTKLDKTNESVTSFLKAGSLTGILPKNANDLSYTILYRYVVKTQPTTNLPKLIEDATKNYINNLAGVSYPTQQPNASWPTSKDASAPQNQYTNMYNVISAVKSFDTFVINDLYKTKNKEGKDASDYSKLLADNASSSDWFETVRTESLGMVIRHLLMYTSQTYVLTSRMLELQKQQLTMQAAANSLLIMQTQQVVGAPLAAQATQAGTGPTGKPRLP